MPAQTFDATRRAGLARLAEFQPNMGRAYAQMRNHDLGPDKRSNVSLLSPWLRTRLLTEREVVEAALQRFSLSTAGKFIDEVCWRTYWKGWLQQRPSVWSDYCRDRDAAYERLDQDARLAEACRAATEGKTGIAVFDAWMHELTATGYLHNHARMWVSSIWIFTLGLPWELGADHFLRHLIDGDAASNTLGWRWVAGLHTKGKTYLARPSNIEKYAGARFDTELGPDWTAGLDRLAGQAPAVNGSPNPDRVPIARPDPVPDGPVGLLLTEEDLHPASLVQGDVKIDAIAGAVFPHLRSPAGAGDLAAEFSSQALADALESAGSLFDAGATNLSDAPDFAEAVLGWAAGQDLREVIVSDPPTGWVRPKLDDARARLAAKDIRLRYVRRHWDAEFWPHATAGFFKLKKKIPSCLQAQGIPA